MARSKQHRDQAAEAERIRKELHEGGQPNGADTPEAPEASATPPEPAPEPVAAAPDPTPEPEPEPAPAPEPASVDWEARYKSLEGKYNAEVPAMRQQLDSTQHLLASMQAAPAAPLMDPAVAAGLSEEEVKEFGPDLIDVMRRVSRAEMHPLAKQIEERQQQAHEGYKSAAEQLAKNAREQLYAQMNAQIPDWEKLNNSKEFLDWLSQPDVLSGRTRQALLTEAFEANDFFRVRAFFEGFKAENRQTGTAATGAAQQNALETLVAPGRPSNTGPATGASQTGRVWTQAEIQSVYQARRAGQINDKEWQPIEADIFAAQRENRIRF